MKLIYSAALALILTLTSCVMPPSSEYGYAQERVRVSTPRNSSGENLLFAAIKENYAPRENNNYRNSRYDSGSRYNSGYNSGYDSDYEGRYENSRYSNSSDYSRNSRYNEPYRNNYSSNDYNRRSNRRYVDESNNRYNSNRNRSYTGGYYPDRSAQARQTRKMLNSLLSLSTNKSFLNY